MWILTWMWPPDEMIKNPYELRWTLTLETMPQGTKLAVSTARNIGEVKILDGGGSSASSRTCRFMIEVWKGCQFKSKSQKQNGVAICYGKKYKKGRTLQPLIAVLCSRICSKNAQTNSSCACLIRLAALCACCRPLGANGGSQGRAASWTHWAPCPALCEARLLRKESMMLRLFVAIGMVCKKLRETKMRFKYSKVWQQERVVKKHLRSRQHWKLVVHVFESTNQLTLDIPQSPFSSRKPIPLMLSSIVLIIIKVGKSWEVGSN